MLTLTVNFIPVRDCFIRLHSSRKENASRKNLILAKIFPNFGNNDGTAVSISQECCDYNGVDSLNVSCAFAQCLGLHEYEQVALSLGLQVDKIASVTMTPESTNDWELLEINAEVIEMALLDQIRILSECQIIPVWISRSISIRLRVENMREYPVGVITNNTEIHVLNETWMCKETTATSGKASSAATESSFLPDFSSFFKLFAGKSIENVEEQNSSHFYGIYRYEHLPGLHADNYDIFMLKDCLKNNQRRLEPIILKLSTLSKNRNDGQHAAFAYCRLRGIPSGSPGLCAFRICGGRGECPLYFSDALKMVLGCKVGSRLRADWVEFDADCSKNPKEIYISADGKSEFSNWKDYLQSNSRDGLLVNNDAPLINGNSRVFLRYSGNKPFALLKNWDASCLKMWENAPEFEDILDKAPAEHPDQIIPVYFQGILDEVRYIVMSRLNLLNGQPSCTPFNHVLIEGDVGWGKSQFLIFLKRFIVTNAPKNVYIHQAEMECRGLKGKPVTNFDKYLERLMLECRNRRPSILFLDDLDALFSEAKSEHPEPSIAAYNNAISNVLCRLMEKYAEYDVSFVATVKSAANLNGRLYNVRGFSVYTNVVKLPALDTRSKNQILSCMLMSKEYRHREDVRDIISSDCFIEKMENYCAEDIAHFFRNLDFYMLTQKYGMNGKGGKLLQDLLPEPLSRGKILYKSDINVTWKSVGGLEKEKTLLNETLIWPSKYPGVFKNCPLKLQSGVLLYGAPGCGKTLLAAAVAGESKINFISIKGPELLSKYVGQSEEQVRATFKRAQNAKPCILFFDEFESLVPRRGNDGTGVTDRVVNQFLTELDGMESMPGVWLLAATSRPDLIDPALLRPGRLGISIHCPFPDKEDRLRILLALTTGWKLECGEECLEAVAELTENFTGADLQAVLYAAHMAKTKDGTLLTDGNNCFHPRDLATLSQRCGFKIPTSGLANGGINFEDCLLCFSVLEAMR